MGISGWRFAFHVIGWLSVATGGLVLKYGVDPPPQEGGQRQQHELTTAQVVLELKTVLKLGTFQVIIAQGMTGTMPWCASGEQQRGGSGESLEPPGPPSHTPPYRVYGVF
jgi:hypothetical protein